MREQEYVHGYSTREGERLADQAATVERLLHHDTIYPPGSRVLEAGCGIGAQTSILCHNHPRALFTSIDRSAESLDAARQRAQGEGVTNVTFQQADIFDLPFPEASFDHVFVCFVLEHLADPVAALRCLMRVLRPGGSLTAIEGDHGSTFFHPRSEKAWRTIQCQIDLQARAGGDSLIGRRLYPLLTEAGLRQVSVSPRQVYADPSLPHLVDGFTRKTFIAMIEGIRGKAIEAGLIGERDWEEGLADLRRTAEEDGAFCYTFFKGVGIR
ncbi:MAG TPA: methyltransferase domain-containing protein [Candidatus Sumerlaeota bacterium]|nr:methyltransferase domain-containing protein [Candidatus Sumerlaeota bacterium]HPS00355.1 methyltransferase domain-containing protein [Candidatus Sumerlaeota bacterium]